MKKLFLLLMGLALAVSAYSQATLPKPLNPKVTDWIDEIPTFWDDGSYTVSSQVMLECSTDWMGEPVADDYPGNAAVFEAMNQGITLEYTYLDPDKVSYSIFTDNDKLFVFTPDRYPGLFADVYPGLQEATRIPFGYEGSEIEFWFLHFPQLTNNVDVLHENGIEAEPFFTWRIGIQSYYTVDGQTSSSDIVYMEIFPQLKDAAEVTSTSFLADWSCDAENTVMVDGFKNYHLYVINTATQDTIVFNNIAPTNYYESEYGNQEPLPGSMFRVENLTPGATYQYYVVSEGYSHTYQSVVREVTLPDVDVYLLGQINDQIWAPNAGTPMTYDAENKIYTATVNLDANESFGFTTELAMYDDQGSWNYIEPFRFGPESNGDFELLDQYLGQELTLTFDVYGAIKVLSADEYKITVSLEENYIIVEKVTPEPQGLRGDVNDDKKVDISDATLLINYLLYGDETGVNKVNANCDLVGGIDISDATALINFLLYGTW